MPKQTFYHLQKDKQDLLINAAKMEFSRVPLHEASIANIIKTANIPRGSFYQYFDDKDDLYYYLLDEYTKKTNNILIAILRKKNGDILETLLEFFHIMIKKQNDQENRAFFKNAFLNMNHKIENMLARNIYEQNQKNQFLSTIKLIDTRQLNMKDDQELYSIIELLVAVTLHNLVNMFVKNLTEEQALKKYSFQIELLKQGIYKDVKS